MESCEFNYSNGLHKDRTLGYTELVEKDSSQDQWSESDDDVSKDCIHFEEVIEDENRSDQSASESGNYFVHCKSRKPSEQYLQDTNQLKGMADIESESLLDSISSEFCNGNGSLHREDEGDQIDFEADMLCKKAYMHIPSFNKDDMWLELQETELAFENKRLQFMGDESLHQSDRVNINESKWIENERKLKDSHTTDMFESDWIAFETKLNQNDMADESKWISCERKSKDSCTNEFLFDETSEVVEQDHSIEKPELAMAETKSGLHIQKLEMHDSDIPDQPTRLIVWFASLIIHAIGLQIRYMVEFFISLTLMGYHSLFFSSTSNNYSVKFDAADKCKLIQEPTTDSHIDLQIQKRVDIIPQPLDMAAKRVVCGCMTAIYSFIFLSFIFLSAFVLSFCIVRHFVSEPVRLDRELYFDYTKPVPVAIVDLPQLKMHSKASRLSKFLPLHKERFHATVYLTLPETDFNRQLGIFQVIAELLSDTGQILVNSSQPCMLHFRSAIPQYLKTLLMAIPLLTGLHSETQTLALPLLDWQEHRDFAIVKARVLIAPRAGRPFLTGVPEIYKAEIRINSVTSVWFSFMSWRWTLSVWFGFIIFVGEVVLILCLYKQLLFPEFRIPASGNSHLQTDLQRTGKKTLLNTKTSLSKWGLMLLFSTWLVTLVFS